MFKKSILMLLLITASSFANCEKPMSQSEMNECSSSKFDIADKELNDIYKELMSKLNDTEKNNLKKEQRKWTKEGEMQKCDSANRQICTLASIERP